MTLEDRLRHMVTALPGEASIVLPVAVVRGWLDEEGDDPLTDLTVGEVAVKLGRAEGTIRAWIRSGKLEAYWLGREYRVTRPALAAFRQRRRQRPRRREMSAPNPARCTPDLGAWRRLRDRAARCHK